MKRQHLIERTQDKQSRFLVRSRLREDGVLSNLFPVDFLPPPAPPAPPHRTDTGASTPGWLYVYEMYVTRVVPPLPQPTPGKPPAPVEQRVSPGRSWSAIQRFLRHRYAAAAASLLPRMIQLDTKVYTAGPLPVEALRLPATYYDLGWKEAELRLVGRRHFTDLPPSELQMVVNKIVLETARRAHERRPPSSWEKGAAAAAGVAQGEDATGEMEVVREKTGKIIFTMQGVSSGGVRVYRGVYVQAVFIDDTAVTSSAASSSTTAATQPVTETVALTTRHLAETPVGLTDANTPLHFRVDAFLRAFAYRGTPVESYRISDASGSVLASLWAPTEPQALRVGAVYAAAPVRIREFAERGNARLVELPKGTVPVLLTPTPTQQLSPQTPPPIQQQQQQSSSSSGSRVDAQEPPVARRLPGRITLKIDTKGTLASEVPLWAEVLQHFGSGPYDDATQARIRTALVNMAVVIAYSLRQSVVREVRFDGDALLAAAATAAAAEAALTQALTRGHGGRDASPAAPPAGDALVEVVRGPRMIAREPRLLPLLPLLDAEQPCAVLMDHTVIPLQVLHCCHDPTQRGWMDIGVATLSLMPTQRMELLGVVQNTLAQGLREWGVVVATEPWRTNALSVLPAPMKCITPPSKRYGAATPQFPTTVVVVGVAGPRCTADQSQRISQTTEHLARYFHTSRLSVVKDESAAVQYVHEQLMHAGGGGGGGGASTLRDLYACVVAVTTEQTSRATRWLKVECFSRGIHCITCKPAGAPRHLNLLGSQLRRQLTTQFEVDPLRGVDLRGELPVLGRRRVLIVGVDTCHTNTTSISTLVGILSTPTSNHILSHFWRQEARGREETNIAVHFKAMLHKTQVLYGGVDEVVIFQDGDVFSELAGMKEELAAQLPNCGLTFMCLHKRCNVRFTHASSASGRTAAASSSSSSSPPAGADYHNIGKGVVVTTLAPIPLDYEVAAPSFYLQTHESFMSTTRAVQYSVHHVSPTFDVADVQQLANTMANVLAPMATKLPMSTRCAHKLAERAERLLDAVPQFAADMIPRPLSDRLWFL